MTFREFFTPDRRTRYQKPLVEILLGGRLQEVVRPFIDKRVEPVVVAGVYAIVENLKAWIREDPRFDSLTSSGLADLVWRYADGPIQSLIESIKELDDLVLGEGGPD